MCEKTHVRDLHPDNKFLPFLQKSLVGGAIYGRQSVKKRLRTLPLPDIAQKPQGACSSQTLAGKFTSCDDDDNDEDDDKAHSFIPKMSIMTILIKAESGSRGENRLWSQTAWAHILAPSLTSYGNLEVI